MSTYTLLSPQSEIPGAHYYNTDNTIELATLHIRREGGREGGGREGWREGGREGGREWKGERGTLPYTVHIACSGKQQVECLIPGSGTEVRIAW